MRNLKVFIFSLMLYLALVAPTAEATVHFGGQITKIIGCINFGVIYARLGPPRGGPYIWSPTITKTYSFGPPSHVGQWLLGNAGPSYYCIERIYPLTVHPGLLILMMGSSR